VRYVRVAARSFVKAQQRVKLFSWSYWIPLQATCDSFHDRLDSCGHGTQARDTFGIWQFRPIGPCNHERNNVSFNQQCKIH
jgi:hypothetical protein